jgi:hypothetical protein
MPEIFRVPPRSDILPSQAILARPEGYHRRGRIVSTYDNVSSQPGEQTLLGDFPGGLKDVNTEDPRVRAPWSRPTGAGSSSPTSTASASTPSSTSSTGSGRYFAPQIVPGGAPRASATSSCSARPSTATTGSWGRTPTPTRWTRCVLPQKYRVFDNIFQCGDGNTRDLESPPPRPAHGRYSAPPQPQGHRRAPEPDAGQLHGQP